jgi:hypothetical protein
MKKVDKPGRDQASTVFVCVLPVFSNVGAARHGERLRGDSPMVQAHPACFVPDGIDDAARVRLMQERWPDMPEAWNVK